MKNLCAAFLISMALPVLTSVVGYMCGAYSPMNVPFSIAFGTGCLGGIVAFMMCLSIQNRVYEVMDGYMPPMEKLIPGTYEVTGVGAFVSRTKKGFKQFILQKVDGELDPRSCRSDENFWYGDIVVIAGGKVRLQGAADHRDGHGVFIRPNRQFAAS